MFSDKIFALTESQVKQIADWDDIDTGHKCNLKVEQYPSGKRLKYVGAIGGSISIIFTPTSLGYCVEAQCACGKKLNVTDYLSW